MRSAMIRQTVPTPRASARGGLGASRSSAAAISAARPASPRSAPSASGPSASASRPPRPTRRVHPPMTSTECDLSSRHVCLFRLSLAGWGTALRPSHHPRLQRAAMPPLPGRGFVESLRRDVHTVRPGHGPALEEEPSKIARVLQRLEDGTVQPTAKIDRVLGVVVERDVDTIVATVLSANDRWQKAHGSTSL